MLDAGQSTAGVRAAVCTIDCPFLSCRVRARRVRGEVCGRVGGCGGGGSQVCGGTDVVRLDSCTLGCSLCSGCSGTSLLCSVAISAPSLVPAPRWPCN